MALKDSHLMLQYLDTLLKHSNYPKPPKTSTSHSLT